MNKHITPEIHAFLVSLGCISVSRSVPDYWHEGTYLALLYAEKFTDDLREITFPTHTLVIVIGNQVVDPAVLDHFQNLPHEAIRIADLPAFLMNRAFGEEHLEWQDAIHTLQVAEGEHEEADINFGDSEFVLDNAQKALHTAHNAYRMLPRPPRYQPLALA